MRAARYFGVPPWDEHLDSLYWVNLAFAAENVEAEAKAHLEAKAARSNNPPGRR